MKWFCVLLLLVPTPLHAAITLVASTIATGGTSGACTTSAIDTTGADLIVVGVSYVTTTATVPTDSASNTFTGLTVRSGTSSTSARLFYCAAPTTSATHTFTYTRLNSYPTVVVYAFSGAAASTYDQESGTGSGSAGTSCQPGSITPPEDNCVLVSVLNNYNCSAGWAINSSFATPLTEAVSASNHLACAGSYKIQTTAGAENPTWSWTGSNHWAVAMASFKAEAASGVSGGGSFYIQQQQ